MSFEFLQDESLQQGILVTTTNDVPGRLVSQVLGVVRGLVVRSPSIGQGIMGSLKAIGGGNIAAFEEVCESARLQAFKRMLSQAHSLGADAIIGMRYDATDFGQMATEVLA